MSIVSKHVTHIQTAPYTSDQKTKRNKFQVVLDSVQQETQEHCIMKKTRRR